MKALTQSFIYVIFINDGIRKIHVSLNGGHIRVWLSAVCMASVCAACMCNSNGLFYLFNASLHCLSLFFCSLPWLFSSVSQLVSRSISLSLSLSLQNFLLLAVFTAPSSPFILLSIYFSVRLSASRNLNRRAAFKMKPEQANSSQRCKKKTKKKHPSEVIFSFQLFPLQLRRSQEFS